MLRWKKKRTKRKKKEKMTNSEARRGANALSLWSLRWRRAHSDDLQSQEAYPIQWFRLPPVVLSSGFQGAWPWPWWMWESSHKSTVTSSQTSVSCNQETGANSFSASCDHNQRTHRRKANDIPPYIAPATHLTVSSKLRISSSDEPWGVSKSSLVNDGRAVPNFYD